MNDSPRDRQPQAQHQRRQRQNFGRPQRQHGAREKLGERGGRTGGNGVAQQKSRPGEGRRPRRSLGVPTLIAAPVSWPKMRAIAVDLVLAGAHPEDILVWDYDPVLSRTEPA